MEIFKENTNSSLSKKHIFRKENTFFSKDIAIVVKETRKREWKEEAQL
jgi:hypothetical protein